MRSRVALALVLVLAYSVNASVVLVNDQSSGSFLPVEVEVPFGKVVDGTSLGKNQTNATVPLEGTLSLTKKDVLYINNTNTSGVHYTKLKFVEGTNLSNLNTLEIGIDNGTEHTQILIDSGVLNQTSGSYVELSSNSTNEIYIKEELDVLSTLTIVKFKMFSADSSSGDTYVISRSKLKLGV